MSLWAQYSNQRLLYCRLIINMKQMYTCNMMCVAIKPLSKSIIIQTVILCSRRDLLCWSSVYGFWRWRIQPITKLHYRSTNPSLGIQPGRQPLHWTNVLCSSWNGRGVNLRDYCIRRAACEERRTDRNVPFWWLHTLPCFPAWCGSYISPSWSNSVTRFQEYSYKFQDCNCTLLNCKEVYIIIETMNEWTTNISYYTCSCHIIRVFQY